MKKVILVLMLAGSISVLEACNSGSASKDSVDSVKNDDMPPSNKDTSKTVTSTGGATLLDYTASGGTTIPKGKPSARTNMNAPVTAAAPVAAAADTAKKDTVKK
jgi:ABC-type oligopeptide transport system substrate-binding subunit